MLEKSLQGLENIIYNLGSSQLLNYYQNYAGFVVDLLCGCGCRNYQVYFTFLCLDSLFAKIHIQIKTCAEDVKTLCKDVLEKKCRHDETIECRDEIETECRTVHHNKCHDEVKHVCKMEYRDNCTVPAKPSYEAPKCHQEQVEVCHDEHEEVCEKVPVEECDNIKKTKCSKIPQEICRDIPVPHCKTVPTKVPVFKTMKVL